ncbi:MAG: T9SS type A sorting domain-containing protein [Crocinitomicaceae bacterium]|nr:T9SS type A sorting domain-containing protein [Crocinitomicaceae bacterium]
MKSLLLLAPILPTLAFSQITITDNDFADGGDTALVSLATDPGIDYASTGTDFTWDFSYLTHDSQQIKDYSDMSEASFLAEFTFGNFASAPYQATNFASSSAIPLDQIGGFLPVNISDVVLFSKNSSNAINSVGYGVTIEGTEVPFKSDTIETRYELPLNYGDVYYSRGYSNLDMNPVYNGIWRQYRQRSSVVDGWGSVTTPYGVFDALRIDHTITEIDSIYIDAFGSGFWVELPIPDSHEYEWWTNGQKEPLLKITVSDILGVETVTNIEYRDIYRGADAGLSTEELNISVYPNPTIDVLHIDGTNVGTAYTIVNVNGEAVRKGICSNENTVVSISELPNGAYQLVLSSGFSFSSKLFIKK